MFFRMATSLLMVASLLTSGAVLAESKVYVSDAGGEIRVFDQESGQQEAVIDLAGNASYIPDLHVHPSGDYLLASLLNNGQLAVIDTAQNVEIQRIDVAGYSSDSGVYSPEGDKLYFISNGMVNVFDFNLMTLIDAIPSDLASVKSMVLSPDGSTIFLMGRSYNPLIWAIRAIDTATRQIVGGTATDVDSYFIASHPSDNSIFVRHLGELRLMDATTLELLPQVLPAFPVGDDLIGGARTDTVAVKSDYLIVNDYLNKVDVYDINDYSLLASIDISQFAWFWMIDVEFDAAAGKFALAGQGVLDETMQGQLAIVDATNFTVDRRVSAGFFPRGMAIKSAAVDLTLQVQRVDALGVQCSNNTTGQVVNIAPQLGVNLWNCTANGLVVNKGDNVTVGVNGNVQ